MTFDENGAGPDWPGSFHGQIVSSGGWCAPSDATMSMMSRLAVAADGTIVTPDHLCPDLLRLSNIGAADGLRGRVVRAFFWVMRLWPPVS